MKVFVDANVLVSVLNKEYPLFAYSAKVLSLNDRPGFNIFTSPVCLAIAFYFSEKKNGNELTRKKMQILSRNISITSMGNDIVERTLSDRRIHDFEDGLEYYSALGAGCRSIVTEDIGDFYFSVIEVLTTRDFLLKYSGKQD